MTPATPAARPESAEPEPEPPEHRNERRRFLIFALMANLIPPARVVDRIIADVESEPPQ
jgi:hypothetical protein